MNGNKFLNTKRSPDSGTEQELVSGPGNTSSHGGVSHHGASTLPVAESIKQSLDGETAKSPENKKTLRKLERAAR